MLNDLATSINMSKEQREQIVLLMGCNEDVRSNTIKDFLDKVDMKEAILRRHGPTAPGTHIDGSNPIDGIFTTRALNILQGGYTSFDNRVQGQRVDHCCLWIDVHIEDIFGCRNPPIHKFQGWRVKTADPRIVNKFNATYKEHILKHKISQKIFELEREVSYPITDQHRLQLKKLATLRLQGIQHADKSCRRLFTGNVEYTPELRLLISAVRFWK